jgi:hypothetical protein
MATARRCLYAARRQRRGQFAERDAAGFARRVDIGPDRGGVLGRALRARRGGERRERSRPGAALHIRVAEHDAARFGDRQGGDRPRADHLALVLSDGGEDVDRQARRKGIVAGNKIDVAFHQIRNKCDVAREAVELGDDQGSAAHAGASSIGEVSSRKRSETLSRARVILLFRAIFRRPLGGRDLAISAAAE